MVRSQYTTLQCIASFATCDLSNDKKVAEGSVDTAYLLEQEENELEEVLTGSQVLTSNSLAFNYFILSQISGADVWYICDLTCSHNIGRMMVTLYMVLPMANMIPLYTLHMCINGTCNRDARCR